MNVLVKFRRPLALAAAVVATAFAFAAQAQPRDAAWPSKPIRFVIPFGAGGSLDVVARLMGRHLEGRLGQNVVVENRPGAGGTVGADSVARAAADGHTFLFTAQGPLVLNPFLMKRLPYNAETAFAPVTIVAEAPNVLVTNQAFPVANFTDLLAFAKSNPDKMTFGTQGVGTTGHVTGELINQLTGLGLTHVAYQGFPPALTLVDRSADEEGIGAGALGDLHRRQRLVASDDGHDTPAGHRQAELALPPRGEMACDARCHRQAAVRDSVFKRHTGSVAHAQILRIGTAASAAGPQRGASISSSASREKSRP